MGGLSHSDGSNHRVECSRRHSKFSLMLCERVTSGVETDKQKPGYHSATGEDEIAPLYITTKRVHCLKVMEKGCYIQCFVYVCLTSQDYCKTEAMLNSNNNK